MVVAPGTLGDRLDIGDAKPARDYDDFVRRALNDIEGWWATQYPALYGGPFEPLAGGVFAAYPARTTPIPGCESSEPTPYEDIALFSAFYCPDGDFIAYDDGDGPDSVLFNLAAEFGPSILGVVFAHEYGHAVQSRAGILRPTLPTIYGEQQADCFAGAWVAHVRAGGSQVITFTDEEVRTGLVAMITVERPRRHRHPPARRPRLGVRPHRCVPDRVHRGRGALRRADRRPAAARAQHVAAGPARPTRRATPRSTRPSASSPTTPSCSGPTPSLRPGGRCRP